MNSESSHNNATQQQTGHLSEARNHIPNETVPLHPGTPTTNQAEIKIGMFAHPDEHEKAWEVKTILVTSGKFNDCEFLLFGVDYTPPAGQAKVSVPVEFIEKCQYIFWLATTKSMKHGYMQHYKAIAQHIALEDMKKKFIVVLPMGYDENILKKELSAYTSAKMENKEGFIKTIRGAINLTRDSADNQQPPFDHEEDEEMDMC